MISKAYTALNTFFDSIFFKSEPQYHNPGGLVDVQLYIFDDNKRFLGRTKNGVWEGELLPGRYTLVPHTTGARLKHRRQCDDGKYVAVVERKPDIKLSKEFCNVLADIFTKADLDANGTLSRTEFNLFNWRTSGEEVSDEEWKVVLDNFPLKDGELTVDGFLTLHHMEAEDNNGDDTELRVTLQTMGYNSQLIQDESSNFLVSVSSTESSSSSLIVSALKSPGLLLDKTVTRCAIMADSSPTKVKGTNNVLVYKEVTDDRITFVIQNKSESSTNIQLDLSKSKNIITNKSSSVFTVNVGKKSSIVAAHVLINSQNSDWNLEAEAKFVRI